MNSRAVSTNNLLMFERYSDSFLKDFSLDSLIGKFSNVRFRYFNSGEFIYRENEKPESVCFILSGEVSIGKYSDDDDVRSIRQLHAGDILGLDDIISGAAYSNSAFAVSNVNLIEIGKSEFLEFTKRNDEFNLWLLKYLSNKINNLI